MAISEDINFNESYTWLEWKISPEGTYLTVIPEFIPEKWDIHEIKNTLLKHKVLNFNISKIAAVIKAASGKSERIGDAFEIFNENKRKFMLLQVTPMQVLFSIDSNILTTELRITQEDILFTLMEKSVVYGISYETIEEIVTKEIYGHEFIIAAAIPPVAGKDAIITEVIPIDPDAKPFLNEDGSVDYKKWDNIRQISKGEVICTRVPPTPGIPGISVFGHPLSPTPGEDFALPVGMNTRILDDETKLVAAIAGFLYRQGRDICVGNIYIIKDDISFKTGNIEYLGDVVVKGNVNSGFSVIADGNISIEGSVESAQIESKKGSVFIKNSVFGQNNASITALKNITADNLQDACVKAGGTLSVAKQIRNCKIETQNLEMPSSGQILSSNIAFRGYVRCGSMGGKTETLNEFTFVENEMQKFKDELYGINDLLRKLNKAIAVIENKIFSIKPSDTSLESENQKKLLKSKLFACKDSQEQLVIKRKKLLRLIEVMPDKEALITINTLMPTLKVSIYDNQKEFKQELRRLKIGWKSGAIKMEAL